MIKLLILDVDGTLTNGQVIYSTNGDEMKQFNVKDGLAIHSWIRLGNKIAIITGRKSSIVAKRAKEIGITLIFQAVKDKYTVLSNLCKDLKIDFKEVAVMGDDLNDLKILKAARYSFAPVDASTHIKQNVDFITKEKAGFGAAREVIEELLTLNNQMDDFLKLWS